MTRFYDAAGVMVDISDNPARGHVRQAVTSLRDQFMMSYRRDPAMISEMVHNGESL
jgi:hypothetical protein